MLYEITLHGPGASAAQVQVIVLGPHTVAEAGQFNDVARDRAALARDLVQRSFGRGRESRLVEGKHYISLFDELKVYDVRVIVFRVCFFNGAGGSSLGLLHGTCYLRHLLVCSR